MKTDKELLELLLYYVTKYKDSSDEIIEYNFSFGLCKVVNHYIKTNENKRRLFKILYDERPDTYIIHSPYYFSQGEWDVRIEFIKKLIKKYSEESRK